MSTHMGVVYVCTTHITMRWSRTAVKPINMFWHYTNETWNLIHVERLKILSIPTLNLPLNLHVVILPYKTPEFHYRQHCERLAFALNFAAVDKFLDRKKTTPSCVSLLKIILEIQSVLEPDINSTQTVSIRFSSSSLSVVAASFSTISFWMVRHRLLWQRLPLFRSKSLRYDTEMTYTDWYDRERDTCDDVSMELC